MKVIKLIISYYFIYIGSNVSIEMLLEAKLKNVEKTRIELKKEALVKDRQQETPVVKSLVANPLILSA